MMDAAYPDKMFSGIRAEGFLKDALVTRTDDDRGLELFIVAWGARTREFRQLDDVARFIGTLPHPA